MDFQKKDWQFRDLITEGELNRMEDGIEEGVTKAEQAQTTADQAWDQAVLARSIAELHADRHATGGADPLTPEMIGALPASQYTASDILNKLKTVDGAGSGLDADTVRGYIPANKAGDTFTGIVNFQNGKTFQIKAHNNGVDLYSEGNISPHYQTSIDFYTGVPGSGVRKARLDSSGEFFLVDGTKRVWHAGNDGAGSGLDADTVRGYIPANKAGDNFTGNINITGSGDRGIDFGNSPKTAGAIGIFPGWNDRLYINIHSASGGKTVTRPAGVEIGGPVYVGGPVYAENGRKVWHAGNLTVETGSWTPVLRFGESTAGITYQHRRGLYTRIANVVYWNLEINLSSKGSASGTANIAGLPFSNVSGIDIFHVVGRATNIYLPSGQWLSSAIAFTNVYLITNTGSYLSNSEFSNNSILRASGFYFI